jgi:osmotically-inducible protein OsmY
MNPSRFGICLLLLGCSKANSTQISSSPTGSASIVPVVFASDASIQDESHVDRTISDSVRDALLAENGLRGELGSVRVTVRDGVVALGGSARSNAISRQIETVARSIGGVVQVENRLAIDPNAPRGGWMESSLDRALSDRVRFAMLQESALAQESPRIGVKSRDGVVILSGTVHGPETKVRAGIVASAVGSVVRVENQLVVK